MVNFQMFNRSTNCAKLRKFSQCLISIRKNSVSKCRIFVPNLINRHFSGFKIAIERTKNCFVIGLSKFFITVSAIFIFNFISRFVCAGNRTKLSFFSFMVNKLDVANFTKSSDMVIGTVTFSRTIQFICTFFSSFRNMNITIFTNFFHYQPLYQGVIYG